MQENVIWVRLIKCRVSAGAGLAKGFGEYEPRNKRFDGPLMRFHKFVCEIVEQLGMRGEFAQPTEIIDGSHKSEAKELVPYPIDHDPGSQGVFRAGDLPCELEPSRGFAVNRA